MNSLIKLFLIISLKKQFLFTECESLPKFNVDINETSISGFSSGAYFAVQVQVAHSSIIKGAGIIAGGPYDCVRHVNDFRLCGSNNTINVLLAIFQTNQWNGHLIDNTINMVNQRVYMLGEINDAAVGVGQMNSLYDYYVTQGHYISEQNVRFEIGMFNHIFPSDKSGFGYIPCSQFRAPFVGQCGYDGAGIILNQIYGNLKPRVKKSELRGYLIDFDQSEFITNPRSYGLDNTGYAYIPRGCFEEQKCRLHIVFHGAWSCYYNVDLAFIENSGYDLWADSNNIILLFPQTFIDVASHNIITNQSLVNSFASWDFHGFYDPLYDTKEGIQIKFIKSLIDRIVSN